MDKAAISETDALISRSKVLTEEQSNLCCLIFGRGDFTPTGNMCRLVMEFIADEDNRSPMQILRDQGHAKWNWYKWQKEYPGFLSWWNTVIEDTIKDEHLSRLYLALYKRALTHDTGAAKLIAQRFDLKYTERSSQDQRVVFPGFTPKAADSSRARQRKVLAERDSKLLPDAQSGAATRVHLIATLPEELPEPAPAAPVSEQGAGGTQPPITSQHEPVPASTPGTEHSQEIDVVLDSEPGTHSKGAGGGFGE